MTGADWPAPAPGAARLPGMVAAQAGLELRTLVRNGEQVLLTLIIPVLLLVVFSSEALISVGRGSRIGFLAPGILALAVLSTSFTSLAIGTAFERRYGVLKRLGATPLSRSGLIAAKAVTVLTVEAGQVVLIVVVGLLLGWRPVSTPVSVLSAAAVLIAGSLAFCGPSVLPVLRLLPSGAMSDGMRAVLRYGAGLPARDLLVLAGWAIIGMAIAARTFRWE